MTVPTVPMRTWKALSEELSKVPNINKSRIAPKMLAEAHRGGRAHTKRDAEGRIVAFGALWPTQSEVWLELGTMFVTDAYKGRGLAHAMFSDLLDLTKRLKKSVFLISKEQKIHSLASGADWVCPMDWTDSPCACAIDPNRAMGEGRKLFYFHQPAS
jgi:GNAT superfamily N-acetyltransferase